MVFEILAFFREKMAFKNWHQDFFFSKMGDLLNVIISEWICHTPELYNLILVPSEIKKKHFVKKTKYMLRSYDPCLNKLHVPKVKMSRTSLL